MNEVSIIINGVRYDAESVLPKPTYPIYSQCGLNEICDSGYLEALQLSEILK